MLASKTSSMVRLSAMRLRSSKTILANTTRTKQQIPGCTLLNNGPNMCKITTMAKQPSTAQIDDVEKITEQFDKNHPTEGNAGKFYDHMTGEGYDEFVKAVNFNEPEHFCKFIGPGQVVDLANPAASEVLDVGAGTGICGAILREKGFTKIVGTDASASLLQKLNETGAYQESRCLFNGRGLDEYPADLKDRFDLVVAGGVWLEGHIPAVGLEDCHASLKPNGYFVTAMRTMYWVNGQKDGYKDKLDAMIAAGNFTLLHTDTSMRGKKGEIGMFEEMESTLLVLQRTD